MVLGRLGVVGLAVTLLAVGALGCSNSNQLRSAKQASTFIDDLLEGNAGKWDGLADDADPAAISLWTDRTMIESLGARLEKAGADWGCDVAGVVNQAQESFDEGFVEILPEARGRIIGEYSSSATPEEINQVIDETWAVGFFTASEVIDAACSFEG